MQEFTLQEEFLDVIYWARQILAIILGLVWGIFALQGFFGLSLYVDTLNFFPQPYNSYFPNRFALVNAGVLYIYFSSFQEVDEEEFGGAWELTKEGFMTSSAGFLVR